MSGDGPMFSSCQAGQSECQENDQDLKAQLSEANKRLSEQILANTELRNSQSKWMKDVLRVVAMVAKAHGLTSDQHLAIMNAVIDPDRAMAEMDSAVSHQQAVGD